MSTRLESALEAGRLYRSTGRIAGGLLRPHVFRSWQRAHLLGADPQRSRTESLSFLDTERLREQQGVLIRAAQPYLRALSLASGSERHAAILGDARAIILDIVGDDQSIRGPERVPGPGNLLDEATCGSNGLGTALAEGAYVEIVGPEHFIHGFQGFCCQGIPLFDGEGGSVGVLSVCVYQRHAAQRLHEILLCSAHAIEMDLLAGRLDEELKRVLTAQTASAEPLARLLGDVLQAQAAVRFRLEIAAEQLAQNHLTHARSLLQLAASVLDRFRRQAALWRMLALCEATAPRPVTVDEMVQSLAELLEIEAVNARVEIVLHDIEAVVVKADPHALARTLFRALLSAIDSAREGVLQIDLLRNAGGGVLRLAPTPGFGAARTSPRAVQLSLP